MKKYLIIFDNDTLKFVDKITDADIDASHDGVITIVNLETQKILSREDGEWRDVP